MASSEREREREREVVGRASERNEHARRSGTRKKRATSETPETTLSSNTSYLESWHEKLVTYYCERNEHVEDAEDVQDDGAWKKQSPPLRYVTRGYNECKSDPCKMKNSSHKSSWPLFGELPSGGGGPLSKNGVVAEWLKKCILFLRANRLGAYNLNFSLKLISQSNLWRVAVEITLWPQWAWPLNRAVPPKAFLFNISFFCT